MQTDLAFQVFYLGILIFSVILHEVAHGWAANALGDPTAKLQGRLTLNPLPHIDLVGSIIVPLLCVLAPGSFAFGWAKPVPYNPYNLRNQRWGEAIVGIAGIAVNLTLAAGFGLFARYAFENGSEALASAAVIVCVVNLSLGLINLIPFPPLDGFTVLRSLLPYRYAGAFRDLEARTGGFLGLALFFFVFYTILARPFSEFLIFLLGLLTGM